MKAEIIHLIKWHTLKMCDGESGHNLGDLTSDFSKVTCSECLKFIEKYKNKGGGNG